MIDCQLRKTLNGAEGPMELDVKFQLVSGSFASLYGVSGAGKTSILRMLAGLMKPDAGYISVNGSTWFDADKKLNLSTQKRRLGFVFQDYALFPNMTVLENLSFALPRGNDRSIIDELIALMELEALVDRKPGLLSGGQQQRVALARAIVPLPRLLLLDEPLSALDSQMRHKLQDYLLQLHRKYELTTLLVSHDVAEVVKTSDQLLVLEQGRISQQGSPTKVWGSTNLSGKFQFTGEIIQIEAQGFLRVLSILIGKDLVKVVADETEMKDLKVGNKVLVASKAFNPIIKKLDA